MARIARLGVQIDSSGARRGAQETNAALKSVEQTADRAVKELRKVGAALGVAFGVRGLQQAMDSYMQLDARLRMVTSSGREFSQVQQQLFGIAQSSRASYAATVDLYTRMARSSDQLGLSQAQLLSVTEAVSNAVRLSNASTGAAEAGLVQLGQAFASGTLRGDELRSIMEQLPEVAKAIADGLGVPIGKLREMGEQGQLSAQRVAQALDSQREKLALLAGQIPTTIGQAIQQLNNAFGMVVAGSNEAKSATAGVASALGAAARFMVEYKDAVVAVSVALGVGGLALAAAKAAAALSATAMGGGIIAFVQLVPAVNSVSAALALLRVGAAATWAAMLGPVGLAIAGITAVAAAVYLWRKNSQDVVDPVKKAAKAAEDLYAAAKKVASVNWVPTSMTDRLRELDGQLQAIKAGGKAAGDAFAMASEEWKQSAKSTKDFATALAEGDAKAQNYLGVAQAIVAKQALVTSATEAGSKAQKDAAKATEERQRAEKELADAILSSSLSVFAALREAEEELAAARGKALVEITKSIAVRARENALLREQVAALQQGVGAYTAVVDAQERRTVVEQALTTAQEAGLALSPAIVFALAAQVAEGQRLLRLKQALKDLDGQNPFSIPPRDLDAIGQVADGLSRALSAAQGLASAFGTVGRGIAAAVGQSAQLFTNINRAQRAGIFTDKNGKEQNVGFTGALSGKAGIAGVANAAGAALGVIGATVAIADAFDLFGNRARERARQMREAAIEFNRALEDFAITSRTSLDEALRQNLAKVNDLVRQAGAATGVSVTGVNITSVADLDATISGLQQISPRVAAAFRPFVGELERLRGVLVANEAELRRRNAAEVARLTEDLGVRRLVAAGLTEQADAERLRLQQVREIQDAEAKFGADSPYLTALRAVQAAETAAAEATRVRLAAEKAAEQARTRTAFGLDLTQRRQTLAGDSRGAFLTGQVIQQNSALAQAQQLVEAGTITAAMFEELRVLLGEELTAALEAFDQAAAESVLQQREDLQVRALVAQGKTAEAEAARREIANRRELVGVTDEGLRAQILYVQGLEAIAIAQAAAAEEAARIADQMADIDRRTLDVLRELDPERAAELEAKQREVDRAKELAGAANDMIRARLEELYALEDAARAQAKLTEELKAAAEAAEALANFSNDLETQWLRATGRTFDADLKELNDWKTNQLKAAASVGLANDPNTQRMINEIYDAKYSALIAGTMQAAESAATAAGARGPVDPNTEFITNAVARSISNAEAIRLIDVATTQLTVLRSIERNTADGSGGGVRITVQITGAFSGAPADTGRAIADQLAPLVQDALGRRVGVDRRAAGKATL